MRIQTKNRIPKTIVAFTAAAAMVCTFALSAVPAHAVTAAQKQAEAQQALSQLKSLQASLETKSEAYYQALYEYQAAVEQRDAMQARCDELQGEIDKVQGRLGDRAVSMYRSGQLSTMDFLLGSTDFDNFIENWELMNRLNSDDANLAQQAQDLHAEATAKKTVLESQSQLADEKAKAAAQAMEESQALVSQMESTYNSLSAEAQQLYAQEQAAAAQAAAAAAAQRQAAAAQAAQTQTYSGGGYGGGGTVTGGYMNNNGTVTDAQTGKTYSSAAEYSAKTGNAIVDRAYSALGSAYVWGGVGAGGGGYDCSGLVSYALTGQHSRIGTTATFNGWQTVTDPQPGDICVVHNGSHQHTGIFIGGGKMIHASNYGTGVIVSNVGSDMKIVRQG